MLLGIAFILADNFDTTEGAFNRRRRIVGRDPTGNRLADNHQVRAVQIQDSLINKVKTTRVAPRVVPAR